MSYLDELDVHHALSQIESGKHKKRGSRRQRKKSKSPGRKRSNQLGPGSASYRKMGSAGIVNIFNRPKFRSVLTLLYVGLCSVCPATGLATDGPEGQGGAVSDDDNLIRKNNRTRAEFILQGHVGVYPGSHFPLDRVGVQLCFYNILQ